MPQTQNREGEQKLKWELSEALKLLQNIHDNPDQLGYKLQRLEAHIRTAIEAIDHLDD